jgi:hypothetical protein
MVNIGSGAQREVEDWNPVFNSIEFDGIRNEAGRNSFVFPSARYIKIDVERLWNLP